MDSGSWGEEELCEKYVGKFPVISISLKSVDGQDWQFQAGYGIGTFAEPGKLADPVQCGNWHPILSVFHRKIKNLC